MNRKKIIIVAVIIAAVVFFVMRSRAATVNAMSDPEDNDGSDTGSGVPPKYSPNMPPGYVPKKPDAVKTLTEAEYAALVKSRAPIVRTAAQQRDADLLAKQKG